MVGADGIDGSVGASGAPGLPGGDGTDGQSAMATATAPGEDNTAEAIGGRGGRGGDGGDAVSGSGADGGDAGRGGSGGHAIVEATNLGAASVRAVARGGDSGQNGLPGRGSSPGMEGRLGGIGVTGGDAIATARVEATFPGIGSSDGLSGTADATAGDSNADGAGGGAYARVVGIATGVGPATTVHRLEARASGGDGASEAGDALAEVTGTATHGELAILADAIGGKVRSRVSPDPNSGNANAAASGRHTGSGRLIVRAEAKPGGSQAFSFPGIGRITSAEGVGRAQASGVATAGADVDVSARVLGGHDVTLRNAVTGSTSGRLSLVQTVDSSVGPVRTELVADNAGGGDLAIGIVARARPANTVLGTEPRDVILGDVIGTSNTGANVDVDVFASGRTIRQEDPDDPTMASRISGISNGGDVSVRAEFNARRVLRVPPTTMVGNETLGVDGVSISMDDVADGMTTGRLELVQLAIAGEGTRVTAPFTPPGSAAGRAIAGAGGHVTNRLTKSGSFESLLLEAVSSAGNGGAGFGSALGNRGGDASTLIEGSNDAGGIEIRQGVLAGSGAAGDGPLSPRGGDASGIFRATTTGDGNGISIGVVQPRSSREAPSPRSGVQAGGGGVVPAHQGFEFPLGEGGDATSRSEARAHGDSEIVVRDIATAGGGGLGGGFGGSFRRGATYGGGGNANSWASGIGGGVSNVVVSADALGGSGDPGGDAEAFAHAEGLGLAQADALARGGDVAEAGFVAGAAHAVAEAVGSLGRATADARTGTGSGAGFRSMVMRATTTATRVDATAGHGAAIPILDPMNQGGAFITGEPLSADLSQAADSHAGLQQLLSDRTGSRIEALARWGARGDATDSSNQLVELDISLAPPDFQGDLALAIYEIGEPGGAFESLRFHVEVLGQLFGEVMVFDDVAMANRYFSSLLVLGDAFLEQFTGRTAPAVRVVFDVTSGAGQNVAYGLAAVVVPEPSTGLLLGSGLVWVSIRRKRPGMRG